jgi:hypothetical protein
MDGKVWQAPLDGGPAILLASEQQYPGGIAVDDASVYFTTYDGGTVVKVPIGGGAPQVLASTRTDPFTLVVDSKYVYWDDAAGEVLKVAK